MSIRISSLRETVGRRRKRRRRHVAVGAHDRPQRAAEIELAARMGANRAERPALRQGRGQRPAEAGERLAVGLECAVAEPFQRGRELAAFLLPEFRLLAFLLDAAVVLDLGVLVALAHPP